MDGTNKRKVLVVDDEPAVRKLVRKMLGKDYNVLEAQNGVEAVDMACSHKPDIILMDMMMPVMDGLTACHAIKTNQTTEEIPVIMLTAINYELNKKFSEDVLGAKGYVTKPFTYEALLTEIRRLQPAALRII